MIPPIFTTLSANAGVTAIIGAGDSCRVYPFGYAKQGTVIPYVTWFKVSGQPVNKLTKGSFTDKIRAQVDCWSADSAGALALARAVRASLETKGYMVGLNLTERDIETRLYRYSMDFEFIVNRGIPGVVAPVADFVGSVVSGNAPLTVNFTDLSTNTPTSWSWDFGDATTSTSQNPTKIYTVPGVYTVTLIATNAAGSDTEIKASYIVAAFNPASLFTGGFQGAWYDPSDLSTMFVDGATPVTADGQSVFLIMDKSQGLALGLNTATTGYTNGGFDSFSVAGTVVTFSESGGYGGGSTNDVKAGIKAGDVLKVVINVTSLTGTFTVQLGTVGMGATYSSKAPVTSVGIKTLYLVSTLTSDGLAVGFQVDAPMSAVAEVISYEKVLGNHTSQLTASARPRYKTSGGLHWLENDGIDDALASGLSAEFDDQWEFWAAFRFVSRGGIGQVLFAKAGNHGANTSSAASQGMFQRSDVVERIESGSRIGGGAANGIEVNSAYVVGGSAVTARVTKTTSPDLLVATSNGNTASVTPTNTGSPATNAYCLFSPSSGISPMYGAFAINRPLTSGEATSLKAYFDAKAGL